MMKTAPDPKDIQEFLFKQSHIHQLVDASASIPLACNLLATDKQRGLLYAAHQNKLIVLKPGEDSDPEWRFELELPVPISKIALNCNCTYLAVAPHMPCVLIYDVRALVQNSIQLLHEIRISSGHGNIFVSDLKWNPTAPEMLCTVASDHTVGNFQIKDEKTVSLQALEKLNGLDVLCAAWSRKGKQIVVGCKNGSIVQLKPDLKLARTIPGPAPYIGGVISILWINTYQFCAAYQGDDQQINVLIVDAPKGEANANFTCYEDITYGMPDAQGEGGVARYYFDHIPEWGIIISASSRSSEIAMLGSTDGGVTWNQWQLVDSGRAQLPLIETSESYPVGIVIDKTPTRKLPWGTDTTLPQPVPVLHILGTSGQLCSFHMVNLNPNCPLINAPATEIVEAPPMPRPSLAPTETSMLMNAVATSTPQRPKPEAMIERQKPLPTGNLFGDPLKPLPTGNLFGDSLKATGFFQQATEPEKLQIKPQDIKPPPPPVEPIPKVEPIKELPIQVPAKPDIKPAPVKETPQESVEQKIIDETICVRAYLEEQSLFEKELLSRQEPNVWECGSEEERQQLAERAATIDQFLRDLKETTTGLSSEIACLKALLLQSFAWVEETKSKNAASNNISSRGNSNSSKINELQTLYYYTQTQLTQATKILDLEWSDKMKMNIPSVEFLYQNLVLHSKIIAGEKEKLVHLRKRWKKFARTTSVSSLNSSMHNLQIAPAPSLKGNSGIIEARCKTIASKTLSFTAEKQKNLRNLLCNSTLRVIKPVNPSPIQDRLEATLSALASRTSPNGDIRNKVESTQNKQSALAKPMFDKAKQQSPLASLTGIVARIGTTETNGIPVQGKPQVKLVSNISVPSVTTNKFPQMENKQSSFSVTPMTPPTKPIQEVNPALSQLNAMANTSVSNILKGFPKMESISFGASPQKPQELQKVQPKDPLIKSKDPLVANEAIKTDSTLFSGGSLNDVLSSVLPGGKLQDSINSALQFSLTSLATVTPKTEAVSPFMMNTNMPGATVTPKATPETPQATNVEKFSFASKPVTALPKSAPMTVPAGNSAPLTTQQPQVQQPQDLSMLSLGSQSAAATTTPIISTPTASPFANKPANVSQANQGTLMNFYGVSISLVKESTPTSTASRDSTVTIEEIPTTTVATSSGTSTIQPVPAATTAASLFRFQPTTPSTPIFGTSTTTASTTSSFGGTATATTTAAATFPTPPVTSMVSLFSGFSTVSPTTTGSTTVTTTSATPSPFQTSLSKPMFGEATVTSSTPSNSGATTVPSATASVNFGSLKPPTTASSVFGQSSTSFLANSQFPAAAATTVSSPPNAFTKPIVSPSTMSFGNFSTPEPATFSSPSSTFGNNWSFGGSQAANGNAGSTASMFGGGTPAAVSSSSNIFGGATSPPMNTFGTSNTGSVFGGNTQKPGPFSSPAQRSGTTSFFGDSTTAAAPAMGAASPGSVFNTTPGANAQMMGNQAGFSQAASFGAKPQGSMFGGDPVFGSGFGTSMFGGGSPNQHAFGGPPTLGGVAPAPMDNKIFGGGGGSDTFETLATQSDGLTFGSLAQKSPEPAKPAAAFGGGSSFSSWR